MSRDLPPLAFPSVRNDGNYQGGMELRDWFAGQVLLIAAVDEEDLRKRSSEEPAIVEAVARRAYAYADAMMAERERVR